MWGFVAESYNDKSTPRAYKRIRKMTQGLLPRDQMMDVSTDGREMTVVKEELNCYTDKDGHHIRRGVRDSQNGCFLRSPLNFL